MATYGEQLIEEGRLEGLQEGLQEGVLKGLQEGVLKGLREGRQEGELKGLREGRQEGELKGQVATIESFLRAGVGWPIIKQATGIDQEEFELLRRQTHASDREC